MSLETGRDTSMDGQDSVGKSGVQSVQRAVRLLEVLAAARGPQTMQSLAHEPVSYTHLTLPTSDLG